MTNDYLTDCKTLTNYTITKWNLDNNYCRKISEFIQFRNTSAYTIFFPLRQVAHKESTKALSIYVRAQGQKAWCRARGPIKPQAFAHSDATPHSGTKVQEKFHRNPVHSLYLTTVRHTSMEKLLTDRRRFYVECHRSPGEIVICAQTFMSHSVFIKT